MAQSVRWLKVDLHMHAPSLGQYFTMPDGENLPMMERERYTFAKRYVTQAHEIARLDLIAITNHNDTSWINPLRQAASELYGDKFVVLPGLEIGADSGLNSIHMLAIFPEDTTVETLERLLDDDLKLTRFNEKGDILPSSKSFMDVLHAINARGGIGIAAHVFSSEDSLLGSNSNKGESRKQQFVNANLAAIDLASFTLNKLVKKKSGWEFQIVTNQHTDIGFRRERPIAILNNSDARRLEDIGKQFTWIKAEKPTFASLKNALMDPEDRVRLNDLPPEERRWWSNHKRWMYCPPSTPSAYLSCLQVSKTSKGFLCGLEISFHPGLNCLIGGRGTGKSAVIELIRYLWNHPPLLDDLKGFEEVFLPRTARASMELLFYGIQYRVSRHGRDYPIVERFEDNEWRLVSDLSPDGLLPLQIYGQKEILHTSRDVHSQLELLDRLIGGELEDLKRKQREILNQLKSNRGEILTSYHNYLQCKDALSERPRLKEKLHTYDKLGLDEKSQLKRQYDQESQILKKIEAHLESLKLVISSASPQVQFDVGALIGEDFSELPNASEINQVYRQLNTLVQRIESQLDSILQQVEVAKQNFAVGQSDWQIRYQEVKTTYRKAIEELPGVTPDTVVRIEGRLNELDEISQQMLTIEAAMGLSLMNRKTLLSELLDNASSQFKLRQKKAGEISAQLSRIRLKVAQGGEVKILADHLRKEFTVQRMREQQYHDIAKKCGLSPLSLLASVEFADIEHPTGLHLYTHWLSAGIELGFEEKTPIQHVAEASGLEDEGWARKLVDRIDFEERLKLDEFLTPDRVTIELNIANQGQADNWRPLGRSLGHGVSIGQGCTAILSIILLESDVPLIIDQPEDDLDNRFIYDEVVGLLRKERGKRQIIVATHNANVPVAGDAEMIIALDTIEVSNDSGKQLQCAPVTSGFIDNLEVSKQVTLVLEGGKEAFRLRHQKYGF